jgi:hypothetical protein
MKTMKGQMGPGALIPFATVLVVAIVLVTVGSYITYSIGNSGAGMGYTCAGTPCTGANVVATASNTIAGNGTTAITTLSSWFNILAIVFIAAVVIGLLLYAFGGKKGEAY